MVVVSDTSPLHYLVLIGEVELLRLLFGEVLVPPTVMEELRHAAAPPAVRAWAEALPDWVKVSSPRQTLDREDLDAGERAAMALALEAKADRVLLDDLAARRACRSIGLTPLGTLGILEEGDRCGLMSLAEVLPRLLATNFRMSPALVRAIISGGTPRE